MERQQEEVGHTSLNVRDGDRAFLDGSRDVDVDSDSTEARLTSSESENQSSDAEGPTWARGETKKTRGCCSVNITTSFVPHVVRC